MSTSVYSHRARVAGLSRDRNPEDAELVSARRDLKAAKLAAYITRVVAAAPPLTSDQCDRIAALLRPATEGVSS